MIRIKLLGKYKPNADGSGWLARFPKGHPVWGNCHFIFDRYCQQYDWLVVYDDLPSLKGERHTLWEEPLACPPEHTLLITTEPSTIKVYGAGFLRQFAWILTSQEPWAIGHHLGAIHWQPGLIWYYAFSEPRGTYDSLVANVPTEKVHDFSAVCSIKRQKNTLHRRRYDFVMALQSFLPEMDLFGRGIKPIKDKADALDNYRYHVAVENFLGLNHWTEKLADPFLGACMPVYYGCPNVEDYFPAESMLRIDLKDPAETADRLRKASRDSIYEKNIGAILESRRLVLENYNAIAQIARLVTERHQPDRPLPSEARLVSSRHALRRKTIFNGISHGFERIRVAAHQKLKNNQS